MIDDKEEIVRYLRSAQEAVGRAIALVKAGKPVAEVRACYARVRNMISDTQEHLRLIKKKERKDK